MLARLARAAIVVLAAATLPVLADAPKRTSLDGGPSSSILWVGNSFFYYNNGINGFMNKLSEGSGIRLRNAMFTISGGGIDWQDIDAYLKPGSHVGSYSFVGDNQVKFNQPGRQFDTVVIMDCSQCPIHPELKGIFKEYAKKNADTARKYGTRPVLFMSWAYKDKPPMTKELADAYTAEANANDMLVIPAGLAFAKAIAKRPDLELYQPDKRHPSRAGSYLAACTSLAALTGKSPVGNPWDGELGSDLAAFLQQVAWDTVTDYYGKK